MIADATVRLVRERTDLVALIGATVKLTRSGRSWKGCCPFHREKTPSFHVSPERGNFHCFGCQKHGSAIDFVMEIEGLTFPDAVRALAERAGLEVEETGTEDERKEEAARRKGRDDLYSVVRLAQVYFQEQLAKHRHAGIARAELDKRLATAPAESRAAAMTAFGVGYAPDGWDGLVTFLRAQGMSPALAEQAGLIIPRKTGGGYYDRFRNRLTFSVMDFHGRPVAFSGRILPDPETGEVDAEAGKYLNSPETPLYRKGETLFGLYQARAAIREEDEAVLVEGNFDVFSLHAAGITNVVAPLGTAFTTEQAKLLRRFAPRVILFFDGDRGGQKALISAREPCSEAGLAARAAPVADGKDPDDLVRERGAGGVRAILAAATGLLERAIEVELARAAGSADARQRAESARVIGQLLESEPDPIVRAFAVRWADGAARRLGFDGSLPATYGALGRTLRALHAFPEPPVPPEVDPHVAAVLGALADVPVLARDPEILAACEVLPEEARQVVTELGRGEALETAGIAPALLAIVRGRLVGPRHDDPAAAKSEVIVNLKKIAAIPTARPRQLPGLTGDDIAALAGLRIG